MFAQWFVSTLTGRLRSRHRFGFAPSGLPPCLPALLLALLLALLMAGGAVAARGGEGAGDRMPQPGELLYHAGMTAPESVSDWVMEGPGKVAFKNGWMEIHSPNQAMHHVFWCPRTFPASFIASWRVQNLKLDAGLAIVFLAATGVNGEDIFDSRLPARDGTFSQYTEGKIKSYHISYYANAAHNPDRGHANLRKNNTFSLLQQGAVGIPTRSTREHYITLVKEGPRVRLYVDERRVIDYTDDQPLVDNVDTGPALGAGKIGFRQMQWTHFRYRDFRVYAIADGSDEYGQQP